MSVIEDSDHVIVEMKKQGGIYLFGDALVQVTKDAETDSILLKPITNSDIKFRIRRILDGSEGTVSAVADDILHNPNLPFRRTRGLVTAPTFREDLSLITTPGFDKVSKLFYAPDRQLAGFSFRTDATHADALEAFSLLRELLQDFPFTSEIDRLSYLAMLLTLFLRSAIPDVVPALLFDANDRSVGKGLLCTMLSLIVYGQDCASMSVPSTKAEWGSKIDSILLSCAPFQVIDNIVGKFANDDFASVLTATRRNVRIKGLSQVRNVPVNTVWVLNGNEIQLDSDMAERVIRCTLQHEDARSRRQESFLIQRKYGCSIPKLLRRERARYMQCCLTIICGWVNDGAVKRDANLMLAKYGTWEGIHGGIFDWLLGKGKLLANHREHTAAVDTDREESIAFLGQLRRAFPDCGTTGITTSQIAAKVFCKDEYGKAQSELRDFVPPRLLSKAEGRSFVTALGMWLGNAATLKLGEYRVTKTTNVHDKVTVYQIVCERKKHASISDVLEDEAA